MYCSNKDLYLNYMYYMLKPTADGHPSPGGRGMLVPESDR